MNKKITFSFGEGLKGLVENKFDFDFKINVYNIRKELISTQKDLTLDLQKFSNLEGTIIVEVIQMRHEMKTIKEFIFEVDKVTIMSISVFPANIELNKGSKKQFTAVVNGSNNPPQDVLWNVTNQLDSETFISSTGLLTIGANEESVSLFVTAKSALDHSIYGTANVSIIEEEVPDFDENYLKMFVATDSLDPNYVSLQQIKNEFPEFEDYWYWINLANGTPERLSKESIGGIDKVFYKGLNDIRKLYDEPSLNYYGNDYRALLFKLSMDSRINDLKLSELATYSEAMSYLTKIGISDITKRHEIFLTHQLRVVNIIIDRMSSKGNNWRDLLDKRFATIVEMLDSNKCFVFDWFSWEPNSIQPTNGVIGGYSTSPITGTNPSDGSSVNSNIIGHVNMEPEASAFSPTQQGGNGEHIAFPYRWKMKDYTPNTGWSPITRWDSENGIIDPMTMKYELSDLRYDVEKQEAFAILDVLIHEMGHALCNYNIFINPGEPRKGYTKEWLSISGWNTTNPEEYYAGKNSQEFWSVYGKPVKKYYNYPGPSDSTIEPVTSQYGGTHPLEDWAESYACYVLNNQYFKDMFPQKYRVIHDYLNELRDLKLNSIKKGV